MDLILAILLVLVSMVLIMFNCDAFEPAADFLGTEVYKLAPGVRGASIEAIASSLPELFTTMFLLFLFDDKDGFAAGIATAAGSAVFNGAVIPALCIFAVTIKGVDGEKVEQVQLLRATLLRDGAFFLIAEIILIVFLSGTTLYWWMGLSLMLLYILYAAVLLLGVGLGSNEPEGQGIPPGATVNPLREQSAEDEAQTGEDQSADDEAVDAQNEAEDDQNVDDQEIPSFPVALITFNWNVILFGGKDFTAGSAWTVVIISTLLVAVACWILAEAVMLSADALDVAPYFTAVILGAAASSVPDTIISYKDALKGDYDDAVANAIGSNIFDICFALGFPLFLYGLIKGDVIMASAEEGGSSADDADDGVAEVQSLRMMLIVASVIILCLFLMTGTSKDEQGRPLHHVGVVQAAALLLIYVIWTTMIILQAADIVTL